jgi:hypothetical protein
MSKSAVTIILFLLLLTVAVAGCNETDGSPALTTTNTPAFTSSPVATLIPTPEVVSKTWNIARGLSGLSITLTVVIWTGDEMVAEWVIVNQTTQPFEGSRLYSIFTPGAIATDQAGREGEFFIPELIRLDLMPGTMKHYETKWIFYPESSRITIELHDIHIDGSAYTDASAQFAFSR